MILKNSCLIIFVQYPEEGKVKTRLARHLTDKTAARLYENFVLDIIGAMDSGSYPLKIYFYPPQKEKEIKKSFGEKYKYAAQAGADLGEKMKNAFLREFAAGFERVVLIGSDCPDLPPDIIDESFRALEDGSDAVIGPSTDGGYYLIGFQKDAFCPEIFSGPRWGDASVLKETLNILRSRGKRFSIMPVWRDVDTREDLNDLINRSGHGPFAESRTMKFLKECS